MVFIAEIGIASVVQDIKNRVVNIGSFTLDNSFLFGADIIVKPGEKINFGFKEDATIRSFFLEELYVP